MDRIGGGFGKPAGRRSLERLALMAQQPADARQKRQIVPARIDQRRGPRPQSRDPLAALRLHQNRQVGILRLAAERGAKCGSGGVGQAAADQQHLGMGQPRDPERLLAGCGHSDLIADGSEPHLHGDAIGWHTVYDKNASYHVNARFTAAMILRILWGNG